MIHSLSVVTYTTTTTTSSGSGVVLLLVILVLAIFMIAAMWKVFQKAGRPGWAAIIPVYNLWVLFEIGELPGWLALLILIPFVNLAVLVLELVAILKIAEKFGKSGVWGFFLLFLLPIIGWPILGFGDAKFQGGQPVAPASPPPAAPPAPTTPPTNPTPPTV